MDKTSLIIGFYLSSLIIMFTIRDALKTLLKSNIRKNHGKIIEKNPPLIKRLFLLYAIGYTKKYSRLFNILVIVNCFYLFLMAFFFLVILLSSFYTILSNIAYIILKFKWIALDIPVLIFFCFATRHGELGGVVWRFKK